MILATVSTRYFDFTCLTDTIENANRLLGAAWQTHCAEYVDADPTLMRQAINDGDVNYADILPGIVLRDGEPLNRRAYL